MNTNQTIDGVPRELLERCARELSIGIGPAPKNRAQELRALLDAKPETVAGHHPACRAVDDYKPGDCSHHCKPAVQPQGDQRLLDPYDGGTFVESAPNGCENCAMELATCDCVEPKPVRWTYSPSKGSAAQPQGEND